MALHHRGMLRSWWNKSSALSHSLFVSVRVRVETLHIRAHHRRSYSQQTPLVVPQASDKLAYQVYSDPDEYYSVTPHSSFESTMVGPLDLETVIDSFCSRVTSKADLKGRIWTLRDELIQGLGALPQGVLWM